MPDCRLLDTGQPQAWRQLLERFPEGDYYFLPEYHRAYELNGDGQAMAFVAQDQERVFFHPFILRTVAGPVAEAAADAGGPWFDAESVRYTGPLSNSDDINFLGSAWAAFGEWARSHRVVAEFIRFNPFLGTQRFSGPDYEVFHYMDFVAVSLEGSLQELWQRYPSVQRNMVRKALKRGLTGAEEALTPQVRQAFLELHRHTLERNQADPYHLFSEPFFDCLWSQWPHQVRLFAVRQEGNLVASGLFFLHGDRLHYHFGNSDSRYRASAPTNLLLHTAAEWGVANGFRWLQLGAGRTGHPQDSLLRFKLTISPLRLPYSVGRRIHNRAAFDRLCRAWLEVTQRAALPPHTFPYRAW